MYEIDQELEDIIVEYDSIVNTLETLEEHENFVSNKITGFETEIQSFDPESIKPPGFKGLNSIQTARATLKTFFVVFLDINM